MRVGTRVMANVAIPCCVTFLVLVTNPVLTDALAPVPVLQSETVEDALTRLVSGLGVWGFVVAPVIMVGVAILPIPAEIPAMLNGVLFGPVLGTAITWSGAVVGALISFELARRLGRPAAHKLLKQNTIDRADTLVRSAGWPVLLIVRFIPTVAFTAVNWAAGFTALPRWTFAWTTAVGILPGAIVFTVSGTGLAAVYRMNPVVAVTLVFAVFVAIGWTVVRFRNAINRPVAVSLDT